jgi:hypothetical protein
MVASPQGKKRNQARRIRWQAARQRIARETHERKERERRRLAKANRVRKEPKEKVVTLSGRAVAVEGSSNRGRFPRKSDLGNYVIRRSQGRQWHIWVQPCWVGVCSPRKHLNEQPGKEVEFWKERLMRCAGRIQRNPSFKEGDDLTTMINWEKAVKSKGNLEQLNQSWTDEITRSFYFLRPEFLPSGRARPETMQKWKIEDELLRENSGWRSVEKGRTARHQEGRKRFKQAKKGLRTEEEISYFLPQ